MIKDDAIVNNILELINEFKEDTSLQNALETKDKSWLTDIMLHRYNMSIYMHGFELYYLLINDNEYGKLQIFF